MNKLPLPTWHLSHGLKREHLQRIAVLTGAALTGTKAQLTESIENAVESTTSSATRTTPELRVMSIDMGIRNLAFAFLKCKLSQAKTGSTHLEKTALCQWQRVDLTDSNLARFLNKNCPARLTGTGSEDAEMTGSFEPNIMATHAYGFAKYCADLRPTHILIERQRFRSGGHSSVQEWSLRVGMLEAMLHATFRTLSEEKILSNTVVEPVLPMRVNKYWFRDVDIPATGKQAKQAKIEIVKRMLSCLDDSSAAFTIGPEIVATIEIFTNRTTLRSRSLKATKALTKLDDMSDSLLQGLAWVQWQENRLRLKDEGPSAFDVGS